MMLVWASRILAVTMVVVGIVTGIVILTVLGVGLLLLPPLPEKPKPIDDTVTWARETSRHLPHSEVVAHGLAKWVNDQSIPAPWDPSSVEEVERIIEEATPKASISAHPIPIPGVDSIPEYFGTEAWKRERLAQLMDYHGARPSPYRDRYRGASNHFWPSARLASYDPLALRAAGVPEHIIASAGRRRQKLLESVERKKEANHPTHD